jgi:hypothetical protein
VGRHDCNAFDYDVLVLVVAYESGLIDGGTESGCTERFPFLFYFTLFRRRSECHRAALYLMLLWELQWTGT